MDCRAVEYQPNCLKQILPGYYLYIEASAPRRQGDLARITTPNFQNIPAANGQFCLSFWYHMYGDNIGSLNVFLNDNGNKLQLWGRSGKGPNFWLYRSATLSPKAPQFTVSIVLNFHPVIWLLFWLFQSA